MKINSSKIISKIVSILAICVLLTSFSPSLDGRAVVVDEGVFPQGLFAKTVGYLPGDIISVTNIAGDANVDLLVIGALDPSEGVAIMLSPEAAAAIGIEKDSNSLVKITKRSNQDERVYGSAVISKPILQNVKEVEEVPTQIDMDNPVVDEPILEVEEEKIEEDSISEISIEEEIVEESVEDEIVEEEIVEEEIVEESVENEVVEDEIIENTDGSLQESLALEDVIFEEKEAEENIVEEKILEELVEDDILPREELVIEESLPEITEDFVEENTVDEESEEIIDENIIDSEAEEEIFVVDEPIADEFYEEDIASTDNEIPAPYFELVEENELEPIDYLSERDDSLEPKEEILEEIPAETEFLEEFVEVEDLDSLESINEEITTDDVEELPAEKEDEPIAFEETDVVILLEEEAEEELEAVEEYEAIVLVPVESNPPVVEETEEEVVTEEVEVAPVEESEVSDVENEVQEAIILPVEPETTEPEQPEVPVVPETPVIPEETATTVETEAPSWEKYLVPSLQDLESGKYYIQIASLRDDKNIEEIISKYANNYPITIVPNKAGTVKQVMVGPLSMDEYGVVLQRFKSYGYKDAFLRKIK
jgi:cell division septation protein DedD